MVCNIKKETIAYMDCLCYTHEKGLFVQRLNQNENPEELVYRPHSKYGRNTDKVVVPDLNLEIEFQSKFGCSLSYLRAIIKSNSRLVLDFDLIKLNVLNYCSVKTHDVLAGDWSALFEKILSGYKRSLVKEFTTTSIAYIKELDALLDKDELTIKGDLYRQHESCWKGCFEIALFAGNKIRDLLSGLDEAGIKDVTVVKFMLNLCKDYIVKIKNLSLDYNDSRVSQVSETLLQIHKFMFENEGKVDYLSLLLDKEV